MPDEDIDFGVLADRYISITPVRMEMTAYFSVEALRHWEWKPEEAR